MAKVTGAGAYKQLQVPKDGISQSFQYWGGINAKRNDDARKRREDEKAKKKDENDKLLDGLDDLTYLGENSFRTVEDAGREYMMGVRDAYVKNAEALSSTTDPLERIRLKNEKGNLENSVKYMKEIYTRFNDLGTKYIEMQREGKLSGVHEEKWKAILEKYDEGKLTAKVDASGVPILQFIGDDGTLEESISFKDLLTESEIYEKVDIPSNVSKVVKMLGKKKYDKAVGGFVNTYDEWGDKQESSAGEYIDAYLKDDSFVADILNQKTGGVSVQETGFSPEQKQEAKDYLLGLVEGAYAEETSKKPYNRPQANMTDGQRKRKEQGTWLYKISTAGASGDPEALGDVIGTRIKVQDGEKTVEKQIADYAVTDDAIVFLDTQGEIVSEIPQNLSIDEKARQIAMIIQNGSSADDVRSLFEIGRQEVGGVVTTSGKKAENKTKVEVPAIKFEDLSVIDKYPINEDDFKKSFQGNQSLMDAGFSIKIHTDAFDDAVTITSPDGVSQKFYTNEHDKIKRFIEAESGKVEEYKSGARTASGKKKTPISQ